MEKAMVWAAERPAVSSAAVAALCVGGAYVGFTLAQRMFGKVITITVPATTANLACGFDAFGAAFELRMVMRVSPAKTLQFEYIGEGAEKVARDESNLIWRSAQACMRQCAPGKTLPPLKIEISNPVPFGRGLGSSATAIIAGVMLANEVMGLRLTNQELIDAALEMENHPDNISPALYGGAVASGVGEDGKSLICAFPINRRIKAVVLIPSFEVSTEKARGVLPAAYSRNDCVYNIQRAGLLPLALSAPSVDVRLIRECMKDKLHQDFRSPLIPGLTECLKLPQTSGKRDLIATALSGAGPTILSLGTGDLEGIGELMKATMKEKGVDSRYLILPFANTGATVQRSFW